MVSPVFAVAILTICVPKALSVAPPVPRARDPVAPLFPMVVVALPEVFIFATPVIVVPAAIATPPAVEGPFNCTPAVVLPMVTSCVLVPAPILVAPPVDVLLIFAGEASRVTVAPEAPRVTVLLPVVPILCHYVNLPSITAQQLWQICWMKRGFIPI